MAMEYIGALLPSILLMEVLHSLKTREIMQKKQTKIRYDILNPEHTGKIKNNDVIVYKLENVTMMSDKCQPYKNTGEAHQ